MSDIVPLRDVPVSTIVDGVEVRGIIYSLYPNDVTVIMTAPVGGLSSGVHVPYFAMERHRLATSVSGRTAALTPYGRTTVERLLKQCYEYSRGKRGGWGIDAVGPAGWFRLPMSDEEDSH